MCGSLRVIGRSRAAELAHLRLGEHPIPTLTSLLHLVAGRVPLLLEVKVDGNRWRWLAALQGELNDYQGRFGVMSFDPGLVRLVKSRAPGWRRGLVIADQLSAWRRSAALSLADPHFLAVQTTAASRIWVQRERMKRPVYSWTVRTADQRQALQNQVDAIIWEGDGRP